MGFEALGRMPPITGRVEYSSPGMGPNTLGRSSVVLNPKYSEMLIDGQRNSTLVVYSLII